MVAGPSFGGCFELLAHPSGIELLHVGLGDDSFKFLDVVDYCVAQLGENVRGRAVDAAIASVVFFYWRAYVDVVAGIGCVFSTWGD